MNDPDARIAQAVARWRPAASLHDVRPLPGGASSLTYRATIDPGAGRPALDVVVKMAPFGLAPVGNRDVVRQARVITGLAQLAVPPVVFTDDGDPPLFAMTFVAGESVEPLFDNVGEPTSDQIHSWHARAHHATRLLGQLHVSDASALAGETPSLAADQIEQWSRALATVDPPFADRWPEVRAALAALLPEPMSPVLCHGDYRLGNMLANGGAISAVIDWEIAHLGDPRLDLAWLRLNADPRAYRRGDEAWLPSPDELLEAYSRAVGSRPARVLWFDALARYKAVATWSLILKRERRHGGTEFLDVAGCLPGLLDRAFELLSEDCS